MNSENQRLAAPSMSVASRKMEADLEYVEEILTRWERQSAMIWIDGKAEDANSYLQAVSLLPALRRAPWNDKAQLDRVLCALEVASARLTEEFRFILVMNSEAVDGDWLMACTKEPAGGYANDDDPSEVGSDDASYDEDDGEDIPVAHPVNEFNASFDPVPPEKVKDLNLIVQAMARIGAVKECVQAYVSVRKTVLEQSLYRLGLEKTSPEMLQKMNFEAKARKWIQAVKVSVKVILPAEKRLCDQVFAGLRIEAEVSFAEVASGPFSQFLAFCNTVAMANRTPEKLFKILEMHEMLEELRPDICFIYQGESVRSELKAVMSQLGVAVRGILQELEALIQTDSTKAVAPGGGHHSLVRYVMNYIRLLVDYASPLERILGGSRRRELPRALGVEALQISDVSPFTVQVVWLIAHLESNLVEKSKLYYDPGMACLFLMNNTNYIVEKVKRSELGDLLGEAWIQKHSLQVRAYAERYVKVAWQKVVSWLTDMAPPPKGRSAADGMSRLAIKERLKNFSQTFEDVYRSQKDAVVPDPHRRNELRMMVAERLLQCYDTFLDSYGSYLDKGKQADKYMKYSPDDLENYVIDLFDPPPPPSAATAGPS